MMSQVMKIDNAKASDHKCHNIFTHFEIIEFHCYIWIRNVKCIQISTNMPSICFKICEISFEFCEKKTLFCMVKPMAASLMLDKLRSKLSLYRRITIM